MDPRFAEAIQLMEKGELSYREISDICDVSVEDLLDIYDAMCEQL